MDTLDVGDVVEMEPNKYPGEYSTIFGIKKYDGAADIEFKRPDGTFGTTIWNVAGLLSVKREQ